MRLTELRSLITTKLDSLDAIKTKGKGGNNIELREYHPTFAFAKELHTMGLRLTELEQLAENFWVLDTKGATVIVDSETWGQIISPLNSLKVKLSAIATALDAVVDEPEAHSLAIQLPPSSSLDDTTKVMSAIGKALGQIVANPPIDGRVGLTSFDRGSLWIQITVGSHVAIAILRSLIRLYYDTCDYRIKHGVKEALLDDLELSVANREEIRQKFLEKLEGMTSTGVSAALADAKVSEEDHEARGRVKSGFRQLTDLLAQGVQVHPMLEANAPSDSSFPDPRQLAEIVKQLEAPPATQTNGEDTTPPSVEEGA